MFQYFICAANTSAFRAYLSVFIVGVESEKVEVEGFRYLLEKFAVDISPPVYFANVAWVAVELCCEPRVFAPLLAHFISYCVADMYHKKRI